jgi:hypothetical protein
MFERGRIRLEIGIAHQLKWLKAKLEHLVLSLCLDVRVRRGHVRRQIVCQLPRGRFIDREGVHPLVFVASRRDVLIPQGIDRLVISLLLTLDYGGAHGRLDLLPQTGKPHATVLQKFPLDGDEVLGDDAFVGREGDGCPVDAHEQIELPFGCLHLRDVDVKEPDGIPVELLALGLVTFDIWQPRDAVPLQTPVQRRPCQLRD